MVAQLHSDDGLTHSGATGQDNEVPLVQAGQCLRYARPRSRNSHRRMAQQRWQNRLVCLYHVGGRLPLAVLVALAPKSRQHALRVHERFS